MKRHPALASLSREHHGALLLSRLLQKNAPVYKNLPTDIESKAEYALNFYQNEIAEHFKEEEKILKLITGLNEGLDFLIHSIFAEHQELRVLFMSINNHPNLPAHLDTLGKALELHVRKEERELFPLIQETCDEDLMKTIADILLH